MRHEASNVLRFRLVKVNMMQYGKIRSLDDIGKSIYNANALDIAEKNLQVASCGFNLSLVKYS